MELLLRLWLILKMKKIKKYRDFIRKLNLYINKLIVEVETPMDGCEAFKRFFKGLTDRPRLKSRRRSKTSFYNDNIKLKVKANMALIEKVG